MNAQLHPQLTNELGPLNPDCSIDGYLFPIQRPAAQQHLSFRHLHPLFKSNVHQDLPTSRSRIMDRATLLSLPLHGLLSLQFTAQSHRFSIHVQSRLLVGILHFCREIAIPFRDRQVGLCRILGRETAGRTCLGPWDRYSTTISTDLLTLFADKDWILSFTGGDIDDFWKTQLFSPSDVRTCAPPSRMDSLVHIR
jgi:hypothetical protein